MNLMKQKISTKGSPETRKKRLNGGFVPQWFSESLTKEAQKFGVSKNNLLLICFEIVKKEQLISIHECEGCGNKTSYDDNGIISKYYHNSKDGKCSKCGHE